MPVREASAVAVAKPIDPVAVNKVTLIGPTGG